MYYAVKFKCPFPFLQGMVQSTPSPASLPVCGGVEKITSEKIVHDAESHSQSSLLRPEVSLFCYRCIYIIYKKL